MSFDQSRTSYPYNHHRQESYGHGGVNSKLMTLPKLSPRELDHHHAYYSDTCRFSPLPKWEKKFCVKVGGMSWKRFVKVKNNLCNNKTGFDKVYNWNDSAGLMAFRQAKRRFYAEFHGFPCEKNQLDNMSSADLYIDKNIDRNPKIDPQLFSEIKSDSDDENELAVFAKEPEWFLIPLEQIKPTGWDDYVYDYIPSLPQVVGES